MCRSNEYAAYFFIDEKVFGFGGSLDNNRELLGKMGAKSGYVPGF